MEGLKIVLKYLKKGRITEEEAIQLIEDLYNKPVQTYWYPWYSTPSSEPYKIEYTVTC